MREAQFHVLTIQSVIREGYGELHSPSTCTVTIPLPLLREPHNTTSYTSLQRTEAGSGAGGISWAFPLVEGGETLPSSCSPLLATFDIASMARARATGCETSTFTLLRSVNAFTWSLLRGVKGHPLRAGGVENWGEITIHVICWYIHRIGLDLHSRPPHCLRVCLVATIATMVAHSILKDFPSWLHIYSAHARRRNGSQYKLLARARRVFWTWINS